MLPSFAGQIARIEAGLVPPVLEVGNLAAEQDFLPVGDVVRAYAELIDRGVDIADGSVFNVALGRPRNIASVVSDLWRHARVAFEVRVAPDRMRASEIPVATGDRLDAPERLGRCDCRRTRSRLNDVRLNETMSWLEYMNRVSPPPMASLTILPVILCGGSGTRLWPMSRESMPKQFARLVDASESTFQATARRVSDLATFARPAVIASAESRFIVAEQLAQAGIAGDIILEPEG
ncbi:sugar phosphate nucleotidyltransferase, partial [Methylobacterium sp. WL120]|uniref:sugar phosphate nucleotidyltransferase n=1 Tax=Methylobacterium sp. WL120 TaxID=2603887 RepID=UPI001FED56AC